MYSKISDIEPLMPVFGSEELLDIARHLREIAAALSAMLHPVTRVSVAELLKKMNSYYSNLIEGHYTHPRDIEKALDGSYLEDPAKRMLQIENVAHIKVENEMEGIMKKQKNLKITGFEFISWLHKRFYELMPKEFCRIISSKGREIIVKPGELRKQEVQIAHHIPPKSKSLRYFIDRFEKFYDPENFDALKSVVAAAASHHRLVWIHPFLDGNGRVARLYTNAYFVRAGIEVNGLWSVTRGLARNVSGYRGALASADGERKNDYDGRGNLSDSGLYDFCKFFIETAIDQVEFMRKMLDLDLALKRLAIYTAKLASEGLVKPESEKLLKTVFLSGYVRRGEAGSIMGKPERTARRILSDLTDLRLLVSETPKSPVRINFTTESAEYIFPNLFPPGG